MFGLPPKANSRTAVAASHAIARERSAPVVPATRSPYPVAAVCSATSAAAVTPAAVSSPPGRVYAGAAPGGAGSPSSASRSASRSRAARWKS